MEESEFITTITDKSTILRHIRLIADQNLSLVISTLAPEEKVKCRSTIQKIDNKHKQIILHQLLPCKDKLLVPYHEEVEITCHMENGTVKFLSQLAPIDETGTSRYCLLSLPQQLRKKQLRTCFRVSLKNHQSLALIKIDDETELPALCQNISQTGALFLIPTTHSKIKQGQLIEKCHLIIKDLLDLRCAAKISHVEAVKNDSLLVGLHFLDLDESQFNAIRPVMNKLERLNIIKYGANTPKATI